MRPRRRTPASHDAQAAIPRAALGSNTQLERRLLPFLILLVFAVVVLKNAWLSDDAFITLRTVRNWLLGFGPVWNVAERVQTYTHPLWMLALTGAIGLTQEYYFTTLLLACGVSLAALFVLVRYLAADWLAAVLAATILILSKSFIDFSTSGLENPLTHLLLALFFAVYLRSPHGPRTLFWLALLAALGAVNRLDTILLFAPPLAYAIYRQRGQRWRAVALVALGFLPLVAWELFSLAYYGFLFPNTYYAKLNTGVPLAESIQQGILYLVQTTGTDLLTPVAIGVGVLLPFFAARHDGGDFQGDGGRHRSLPALCGAHRRRPHDRPLSERAALLRGGHPRATAPAAPAAPGHCRHLRAYRRRRPGQPGTVAPPQHGGLRIPRDRPQWHHRRPGRLLPLLWPAAVRSAQPSACRGRDLRNTGSAERSQWRHRLSGLHCQPLHPPGRSPGAGRSAPGAPAGHLQPRLAHGSLRPPPPGGLPRDAAHRPEPARRPQSRRILRPPAAGRGRPALDAGAVGRDLALRH